MGAWRWWKLQGLQQGIVTALVVWATMRLSGVAAQTVQDAMSCRSCCTRDVFTTLWGGVATLVALAADSWGSNAHIPSLWRRLWMVIFTVLFSPKSDLVTMIYDVYFTNRMMEPVGEEHRESAKVIARCVVAVSVSPGTHRKLPAATSYAPLGISNRILLLIMREELGAGRVLEPARALKFGAPADDSQIVILNTFGKAALLRAGLVWNPENLHLLEACSPVAVIVSGVQAGGYIIAVLVRLIQNVAVSPIEQISCLLSGIVICKCFLHIFVRTTHHPYWIAGFAFVCCVWGNMLSYLVSVIATLMYWRSRGYDAKSSFPSQFIPHIG